MKILVTCKFNNHEANSLVFFKKRNDNCIKRNNI